MIRVPGWTGRQWRQFAAHWYQVPGTVNLARQCEVAGVEADFVANGRDQILAWTIVDGIRLVTAQSDDGISLTVVTAGSLNLATDLNRLIATEPYPAHASLVWLPWATKPGWLIAEAGSIAYELGRFLINARPELTYLVDERIVEDRRTYHLAVGLRR
jgi:hypothetical protein